MFDQFPEKINLANTPTPLVFLEKLSKKIGGPNIWLKRDDFTGSFLTGNKVRKLEYIVARALKEGASALITCGGIQSNHCRATALVCAQLGLEAHLVLRKENSLEIDGNYFLDNLAGANIHLYSPQEYFSNLENIFVEIKNTLKTQGKHSYSIPTGASDGVGIWGYVECVKELKADFELHGINPEYIVCATGSGGTQSGLSLGSHLLGVEAQTIGYAVCDDANYFNKKARKDIEQCNALYDLGVSVNTVTIKTIDDYIGPGYAKGYPELYTFIKEICRLEGIVLDPVYTGKAFYGLVNDINSGRYQGVKDIVFIHTGGVYGLFPFRNDFHFV